MHNELMLDPTICAHNLIKYKRVPKILQNARTGQTQQQQFSQQNYVQKIINTDLANKRGKNTKTPNKTSHNPKYYYQRFSAKKKAHKYNKKAPQSPRKTPAIHLGRKVNRS